VALPVVRSARVLTLAIGCLVALAACGGDDDDPSPTATSPAQATATETIAEPTSIASPAPIASPPVASPVVAEVSASPVAGAGTAQPASQGATVVLTDYRVSLFQTSFVVGQPYTFVVENNGGQVHAFVIEQKGAQNQPLESDGERAEIVEVPAGGRATLLWTFDEPGEYQIACHRDGHYERGMVLDNIVVEE
jgi:uncharacterized cupredoxin-like copper-binding protein